MKTIGLTPMTVPFSLETGYHDLNHFCSCLADLGPALQTQNSPNHCPTRQHKLPKPEIHNSLNPELTISNPKLSKLQAP